MNKKSFKIVPKPEPLQVEAIDKFVANGPGKDINYAKDILINKETQKSVKKESTKRLTVDMPKPLHLRFKSLCAQNDLKMNDEIRQFIEKRCEELI